jgi:excisionase family DNA binding protein
MNPINDGDRYGLSVVEAAARIGVSERMVRGLIAANAIPHYRIGKRVFLPWPALRSWMENGGTGGAA